MLKIILDNNVKICYTIFNDIKTVERGEVEMGEVMEVEEGQGLYMMLLDDIEIQPTDMELTVFEIKEE